jgi:acyl-CoA-binding protein
MVSKEEFEAAAKEAGDKDGPLAKISNEQKLNLYALYKQVG